VLSLIGACAFSAALRRPEASTDRAVRPYREAVRPAAAASNASAAEQQAVTAAGKGPARLPAICTGVGRRHLSRLSAVTFYRNLAVAGFRPERAVGAG
jgi:hypothetical protein